MASSNNKESSASCVSQECPKPGPRVNYGTRRIFTCLEPVVAQCVILIISVRPTNLTLISVQKCWTSLANPPQDSDAETFFGQGGAQISKIVFLSNVHTAADLS